MAEALILDAEAVHALARATERGILAVRARGILAVAYEVKDRGIPVCDLSRATAQRAGALLSRAKLSSRQAVNAFVVSTALDFDAAVIATGDPDDIRRLAAPYRQVRVFAIGQRHTDQVSAGGGHSSTRALPITTPGSAGCRPLSRFARSHFSTRWLGLQDGLVQAADGVRARGSSGREPSDPESRVGGVNALSSRWSATLDGRLDLSSRGLAGLA